MTRNTFMGCYDSEHNDICHNNTQHEYILIDIYIYICVAIGNIALLDHLRHLCCELPLSLTSYSACDQHEASSIKHLFLLECYIYYGVRSVIQHGDLHHNNIQDDTKHSDIHHNDTWHYNYIIEQAASNKSSLL